MPINYVRSIPPPPKDILASVDHVLSDESFKIPERRQMVVFQTLQNDGELEVDGTILILG